MAAIATLLHSGVTAGIPAIAGCADLNVFLSARAATIDRPLDVVKTTVQDAYQWPLPSPKLHSRVPFAAR
jgi:hypothetical protein